MFRCDYSKEVSLAYEKPVKLVIEKRNVEYKGLVYDPETGYKSEGIISTGWEIVKEINVRDKWLQEAKERYGVL